MYLTMKGKKYYQRETGKVQASVLLPEALVDKIEALAASQHRSRNKQIEAILDEWFKAHATKPLPSEREAQ